MHLWRATMIVGRSKLSLPGGTDLVARLRGRAAGRIALDRPIRGPAEVHI